MRTGFPASEHCIGAQPGHIASGRSIFSISEGGILVASSSSSVGDNSQMSMQRGAGPRFSSSRQAILAGLLSHAACNDRDLFVLGACAKACTANSAIEMATIE